MTATHEAHRIALAGSKDFSSCEPSAGQPARHSAAIENAVPHGRTDNGGKNDRGAWSEAPVHHLDVWAKMEPAYQAIIDNYPKLNHVQRINHLGTLSTGNHFIEVCLDGSENVWFLLHSGSRGVGNRFGTFFTDLERKICASG